MPLTLLFLAACASLSKEQCLEGDWYQIGVGDGIAGYDSSRLADHAKACGEVGITPVRRDWEAGRKEGLKTYCTPQSAYQVGRKGRDIGTVCTPAQRADMAAAYNVGLEYYGISQKISRLEQDIQILRSDIQAELTANNGVPNLEVLFLQGEIADLNRRIGRLEGQRLQFAAWP